MSMSYVTMWGMLFLLMLGALGGGIIHGDIFGDLRDAYPSDPARREALNRCQGMMPEFSRFSGEDRETCYRTLSPEVLHAAMNNW
jgi:hypothetical protein